MIGRLYTLEFDDERPFVRLFTNHAEPFVELLAIAGVDTTEGRDDTIAMGPSRFEELGIGIRVTIPVTSSLWKQKLLQFVCEPDRIDFLVEVKGHHHVSQVTYFGGYLAHKANEGLGFYWSRNHATTGFTPEPNVLEQRYFQPTESTTINLTGGSGPGRGDWFFTPPPFCLAFAKNDTWLGIGVTCLAGSHLFTEFGYHANQDGFYLSLQYEGHTTVNGRYVFPAISLVFADTEYAALEKHVAIQTVRGGQEAGARTVGDWWQEPIFCGWGAQSAQAALTGQKASEYAHEQLYRQELAQLSRHGVIPGTVVIDDKWQVTYGENQVDPIKWPDLRRFVFDLHQNGQRVLLWLKAWDPEGIAAEECVVNALGEPIAVDPTNPLYEARLQQQIRDLLSPEGFNADGFKIDFTARIPSGPRLRRRGPEWGLELMKRYLEIIYRESKRIKSDALIITHTPHPYLADVTDMIRLNDVNIASDINSAMEYRARVAALAAPGILIDTDNWPMPNKEAWRSYLKLQGRLGVPSLYYSSRIDTTLEAFDEHDYELIRQVFENWRATHPAISHN